MSSLREDVARVMPIEWSKEEAERFAIAALAVVAKFCRARADSYPNQEAMLLEHLADELEAKP